MRKLSLILLTLVLAFAFVGCKKCAKSCAPAEEVVAIEEVATEAPVEAVVTEEAAN